MALRSIFGVILLATVAACSAAQKSGESESTAGQTSRGQQSSAIPAKREFPIDPTVEPCHDFYAYACNKVVSSFKLRDDRSSHTFAFDDSSDRILDAQMRYLSSLESRKDLSPRARELQDYFKACMAPASSAAEERAIVNTVVAKVKSIRDRREFQYFVAGRIGTGDASFIDFGATANTDDSAVSDLFMLGDLMTLPEKSYYEREEVLFDMENAVTKFFSTIGLNQPSARAKWVVQFEKEFAKTFPLPRELRSLIRSKTGITRKELLAKYPNLKLGILLKKVPSRTHIRNLTPENFAFINHALGEKPLEQLKSVYLFHALKSQMDDAYPDFYAAWFSFKHKHLGGSEKRAERKERCTFEILENFPRELDAEVVPLLFPTFPEERVRKMAEGIRGSIISGIERNDWLSSEAKAAAVKKMKTAGLQLVKPQKESEWDFNLPADYSSSEPYANSRLHKQKNYEKALKQFRERRDPDLWLMSPLEVNAGYSSAVNRFVLPIGILQPPFFDPGQMDEANFGSLGTFIGHELGHAIDSNGSKYDYRGTLKPWMTEKDLIGFKSRAEKLVSQFNAAKHDGELTLPENTADLVGLTFAYEAAFPNGRGAQEAKRAFFLQYARALCGVMRSSLRERMLKTDPHAMGDARVREQVKHQVGFQEAFSCKENDPMILPASLRVKIW